MTSKISKNSMQMNVYTLEISVCNVLSNVRKYERQEKTLVVKNQLGQQYDSSHNQFTPFRCGK